MPTIKPFPGIRALAFCFILQSCSPGLLVTPIEINVISQESGANYCYLKITNTSNDPCQFAIDNSFTYLSLVSTAPTVLQSKETIEAKFKVSGWNASKVCMDEKGKIVSCIVDSIRVRGLFDNGTGTPDLEERKVNVRWSTPLAAVNCWFGEVAANTGDYQGGLCDHPQHDNNTVPYSPFSKINYLYNPNPFEVQVLVDCGPPKDNPTMKPICICTIAFGDDRGTWHPIPAFSYYAYGDTIRKNFGGATGACNTLNNGTVTIHSLSPGYVDATGTKWVPMLVYIN